jgi:hypothetical protein
MSSIADRARCSSICVLGVVSSVVLAGCVAPRPPDGRHGGYPHARASYSRRVRVVVEQVIQTATKVLDGGLTAREAVTVLATLTREAVPAARRLRAADPDRAATYRELILALGQELRSRERTSDEPRHLRAVTDDLAKILDALG